MRVQITARHCDLSDPVRERAQELSEKLTRFDPRVSGADLIFEEEKRSKKVEAILSLDRVDRIVASAEGQEWMGMLDKLFDRLSRQVRRSRSQAVDHKA
ncbi:MAG: HPF/RaiA family ribosome-associated protein [Gemmatimonadetes bacterium]|nr:HPF/RaiA family ribosome-associated protein [Gemmatimonadota bacterium]MBT8403772.1 HPF/RaiA family ribosome-associated protein [Gemmatimonadota bacterium]NNF38243.1 ribosome-associated translation inhibitor RaiA [Gemmatimonadota bacterium]NNK62086.1 ribosome-associated translation inhibitor RaiA [Gemmatimonadota bacterium]